MINHHLEVPFLPLWALPLAFYLCSTSTSDPKPQMARVHVFRHICGAHSWLSQALAPTELLAAEARGHLSLAEVGTEEFLKKLTSQITEMVSAKITQGKSGC